MAKKPNTGKPLERRIADAYRRLGVTKVEHDIDIVNNFATNRLAQTRPHSRSDQPVCD